MLEALINPKEAENKPLHVFFVAILFTLVSIYTAQAVFSYYASMLTVAFITILFVPLFQRLFVIEEEKERKIFRERMDYASIFRRHEDIIKVYTAFFLGVVVATTTFLTLFPQPGESVFKLQMDTLAVMRGTGAVTFNMDNFFHYLSNNTSVLGFAFLISFFFGTGAVFILSWNATVIGTFLYIGIKSMVEEGAPLGLAYLYGLPAGLLSISIHGIPEILGYFFAGIAGGILSVGVIRERIFSNEFRQVFRDSLIFLLSAEVLIVIGAFLEAFY